MNEVAINPLCGKVVRFRSRASVKPSPRLELQLLALCEERLRDARRAAMRGGLTIGESAWRACADAEIYLEDVARLLTHDCRSTDAERARARAARAAANEDAAWLQACNLTRELWRVTDGGFEMWLQQQAVAQ